MALSYQRHHHRAPGGEEDVANRVRHGEAEYGDRTPGFFHHRLQGRCRGACAGRRTEQHTQIHLQYVAPHQEQGHVRNDRHDHTSEKELQPKMFHRFDGVRSRANADDGNEHIESDRLHEPDGWAWNAPERRIERVQPTEYQPGHEHAAAGAESNGNVADANRQRPDQRANDNGDADKDNVGFLRRAVSKADTTRDPVDVLAASRHFQHVAAFQAGAWQARQFLSLADDLAQMHPLGMLGIFFHELAQLLSDGLFLCNDHWHGLKRHIHRIAIHHFLANLRANLHEHFAPAGKDDDVPLADDFIRRWCDELVSAADALDV